MNRLLCFLVLAGTLHFTTAQKPNFSYLDIFDLQYASDPQISPNGEWVVYRKMGFDIMKDRSFGNLWLVKTDGTAHQKLTAREVGESSPRWSPSGDRIAFSSSTAEGAEIYMYWVASGKVAKLTQLPFSPSSLTWSPDGKRLAFSMNVPKSPPVIAKIPKKPKGAKWAESPRITDRVYHEADGRGYIKPGFNHIFTIPAEGGAARQITSGDWHHRGTLSWSPDGSKIYFSANRIADWEYQFRNSEIYSVAVEDGEIEALTDRNGPDYNPQVSPDGKLVAYLGFEDKVQAYQTRKLHIMDIDGKNKRVISEGLDRTLSQIKWNTKGDGLYVYYDDKGNGKVGFVSLSGNTRKIADNIGGTTLGRPYPSGSYSVSKNGTMVITQTRPNHPADLAVLRPKSKYPSKLTNLNGALLNYRTLGKVEEVWYKSSVDGRDVQGWVVYPPNYDKNKKYPFMVENHGGPILNYGDRFSIEMQLYASEGYIVFYPNPRGSTSYGEEFGNLLYNNYPGEDYNDVMDGVDHCIKMGIAHEDQLFVTGGSAGGIMSAWIIGKNNRFEAAVVAKPVMNWISKTLVADNYFYYFNHRYPGQPWENFEGYWKFSPISLVGNVETPTMVMVGMDDLRTPPSEAKQLYHALKLRKIETVLVEIPGASHGIASKPSNLMTKIAHTVAWFDKFRTDKKDE
ncbi:alpha/beta hydrolase family protein [Flagellimonas nanhaiensis]|uniref:S9 family peptidase n=1 Tax=Flagellimonas nanhaiensis TaxID=2292706 RepID=A0A371JR92_9FLAO|nr:S9 family peptidase [Allomuricauda nanhaiensis]RDY60038.1 S9 family peptidase [Allomuricauda nanhaiensis]